ncbi:hypothetical protein FJTKL_12132 [Diaporthe vaccinii]|uniref:Peptidase S8/S53 domain-containing protein n=1 Tax=Diaporthe vaccinii TaxID=105482 RepID=A0ABR4EF34_9PEZI
MTTHRLELQVKNGKLFKLRSERSDQLIDLSKTPVSLDEFFRAGPRSFTEKTKRILMIILSCTVLHLHDTPWLQPTWNSANVIFFRSRDSETPLRPFLDTSLSSHVPPGRDTTTDPDEYEDEDIDPDDMMQHPCPIIVTLAVMLMEVFFAAPFDELAQRFNVKITGETAGLLQCLDADMVFQACKGEIPENSQFLKVIDKCLDPTTWKDEDDATLGPQALRGMIYEVVVKPLENDLRQAYSSISIESLDHFAQSLDMSSWDQAIRNQRRDGELAVQLRVGLDRTRSPFSNQNPQPGGPHSSVTAARAPNHSEYRNLKFFDDEATSREQSGAYADWKAKYFAVYKKSIIPYAKRAPNRVKIAVLDTGIDLKHPEIQACSDNIQKKYNFLTDGCADMGDSEGHGTFVTALLLEYAPDADIYIGKVTFGEEPSSPDCIAKAIRHAVDKWKVDMISMSFGYPTCSIPGYSNLEAALEYADCSGVLLFAAASNNGGRRGRAFPAQENNVICVHSTDTNANRSSFSPTPVKSKLNFATVGECVESAWPEHLCNGKSVVAIKSGTSFATPIMVGVAALLVRYIRLHIPDAKEVVGQRKMENLLRKVAKKGPDGEERDGYWFVDLSLFDDSLFGKEKIFIDSTIRDILNS